MLLLRHMPLGDEGVQALFLPPAATVTLLTRSLSFSSASPQHLILSFQTVRML